LLAQTPVFGSDARNLGEDAHTEVRFPLFTFRLDDHSMS
jgi:hypothetical protein